MVFVVLSRAVSQDIAFLLLLLLFSVFRVFFQWQFKLEENLCYLQVFLKRVGVLTVFSCSLLDGVLFYVFFLKFCFLILSKLFSCILPACSLAAACLRVAQFLTAAVRSEEEASVSRLSSLDRATKPSIEASTHAWHIKYIYKQTSRHVMANVSKKPSK